jgi:ferrous iron transport protein B
MKKLKILLVGQPNVGKSSLLNALVGPIVTVSNYPGTTVEITKARKSFNKTIIEFVDTPGIYSVSDRSEEEKVTERALFEEEANGVILIADATSLERSLYIALQVLEAQIPTILALNFVEDAEKKGIEIDCEKLQTVLNIPVAPINPLTKKGIDKLIDAALRIEKTPKRTLTTRYDDHIENAIDKISSQTKETSMPKRFVALRVLEGDKDFYYHLKDEKTIKKVIEGYKEHPKITEDIAITRYGTASFIAEKVTQIVHLEKEKELEERIDQVLLHKILGPVTTGLLILSIFGTLLYLGNIIQGFLMDLTENFMSTLYSMEQSIVSAALIHGINGLAIGVSIALPYVFLFYFLLGLMEDIGLLSRFIVNAEIFLKKLGLPGKSFIPLALGLGCTAPATRTTRVLSSEKEQFHTATLFAFVPCSSRIAIIMGIVGFYGNSNLAFLVFVTSFIAGLIWAFGVKKFLHIECEPLLLELPPYRKPLIKNILAKSWIRMKDFVYIVLPLLALGGITYGILDTLGFTNIIVKPLSPFTNWLGLPSLAIIPLIFGFLQKDLTGAMLLSVLGNDISSILTPLQIYTFGLASTIGIPCMIAFGILTKEFGFKKSIFLTVTSILYGLLVAGLTWRMISVFAGIR